MAKRIVICADGTWNTPDQRRRGKTSPTNVAKMAEAIACSGKRGSAQLVFYDKGVGTGRFDRLCGGAFGYGLSKHVENAYRFLVEHYQDGDEIYFFGFSRGAYAVRSAAGFLHNCGLLRKEWTSKFTEAYELYRRRDSASKPNAIEARLFRKSFAREVKIKFIGVWDTVGALGIPPLFKLDLQLFNKRLTIDSSIFNKRWGFHDVALGKHIENAFQALAIDETRKAFEPAVWKQQVDAIGQKLEQVWFAGVHSDIGGGYDDTGLSDIAFLWMKERAEACGLSFDDDYIREHIRADVLGELHMSRTGMFKLLPGHPRLIGHSNGSVCETALERMDADPSYQPPELIAHRENKGSKVTLKPRYMIGRDYQQAA